MFLHHRIKHLFRLHKIKHLFRPSWLVPTCLLLAIATSEIIVLRREDPRITEFITVTGVAIAVWVHFLHRRKIWEKALGRRSKAGASSACSSKEREIDYLLDYLHLDRAIQDRQIDRIIEARLASDERKKGEGMKGSILTVFDIREKQMEIKVESFLLPLARNMSLEIGERHDNLARVQQKTRQKRASKALKTARRARKKEHKD